MLFMSKFRGLNPLFDAKLAEVIAGLSQRHHLRQLVQRVLVLLLHHRHLFGQAIRIAAHLVQLAFRSIDSIAVLL